ncbi:ATP-binding cassette (ABC) Superfamily [Phytophthora palmivora]|uniref:ATP-binding cassette (ABC) Superfamily n=1 Tax=Phytophthora palmivora TaxID=4796 RepID=A0A2P4YPA0_9STRA|nr:ATP-binding cassette (ABC) Superfamily [Phytophthora palmivora]
MTLNLGQPGSGKSSLMKVLNGRFPKDKNVTVVGYNGEQLEDMCLTSSLDDYFDPVLTVI